MLAGASGRLARLAPPLRRGLLVVLALNAVILGAYLWSRGGQRTVLSIEVTGDRYRVELDGKRLLPPPDDAASYVQGDLPSAGSISLSLSKGIPSLPDPQGIDSVVVRDPQGRVVFRDDFERLDESVWRVTSGSFAVEDGVLVAKSMDAPNQIDLQQPGWRDYEATITYRNGSSGDVWVRRSESGLIMVSLSLVVDFPGYVDVVNDNGEWAGREFIWRPEPRGEESLKSVVAMAVGAYPLLLLALGAGFGLAFSLAAAGLGVSRAAARLGIGRLARGRLFERAARLRVRVWAWPVLAAAAAAFGFAAALRLMLGYHFAVPQLPDEDSYLFQAKLFASGRLTGEIPPVREAFYHWLPNFLYEDGDRWSTFYPFGHPLTLAAGALFDAAWVMPPLVGAGSVAALYALGRRLYSPRVGGVAAVLLAGSPFFLMQSSNFMAHGTWTLFALLALLFAVSRERPLLFGALGGLCFGLALNTRTIEALVLAPFLGAVLLAGLRRRDGRVQSLKHFAAYGAAAEAMVIAMLLYNSAITGSPLTSPYQAMPTYEPILGFSNGHTLDNGLRNLEHQIAGLSALLDGWPAWLGLGMVILPFVLGTRKAWDYFCAAAAAALICLYVLYQYPGMYEGPRYLYHAVPFLLLLAARGADAAATSLAAAVGGGWRRLRLSPAPARWAPGALVYGFLAWLVIGGTGGWLFAWKQEWRDDLFPNIQSNAEALRGPYHVDRRLIDLSKEMGLKNALVLLQDCGEFLGFACYGAMFTENDVDFRGDVVWARYIPERLQELIQAFPGRTVYLANWEPPLILPYPLPEQRLGAAE